MVKIPYIKIPSVRVGSIGPTSNIGAGGATPAPPPPITYLTQWRMMGNSTVHTDSYLTQWKVSGNSVVDNNTILSCGDLGQDGKYHVMISNGVDIFDIALTEPLRKVGDVADSIEFVNGSAVLTRKIGRTTLGSFSWIFYPNNTRWGCYTTDIKPASSWRDTTNILCPIYNTISDKESSEGTTGICMLAAERMMIKDSNYTDSSDQTDFEAHIANVELIYEKITPTTETIQVSPFPISPTDTYTSANDTPYSAFEYKKNVEIWSCGEYSEVDGKYHILVQPLGGSIADIALDEPLRKVNDVADSIEFVDGVATLTRNLKTANLGGLTWSATASGGSRYRMVSYNIQSYVKKPIDSNEVSNVLCTYYNTVSFNNVYSGIKGVSLYASGTVNVYDDNYNQSDSADAFKAAMNGVELIYELATPTTETIQVPQITEADSYSCVISQGGKAVSWSSFETNSE